MKESARAAAPLVLAFCEADAKNNYEAAQTHAQALQTLARIAPTNPRVQKRIIFVLTFRGNVGNGNSESFLRETVLDDLPLFQLPAAQAIPALVTAISDAENIRAAIAAIGAYGTAAKSAVPALTKLKLAG